MAYSTLKRKKILLEIETDELSPAQIRLIRSINTMLGHIVSTDEESEFFEGSAELMRMCASLIKQANFANDLKGLNDIPYAQQALEYSMDTIQDLIDSAKIVNYDN